MRGCRLGFQTTTQRNLARVSKWRRPFNLNYNGTVHSTGEVSECSNKCEIVKGEFKRERMRVRSCEIQSSDEVKGAAAHSPPMLCSPFMMPRLEGVSAPCLPLGDWGPPLRD